MATMSVNMYQLYLLKGANEFLPAQSQVLNRPHHPARCCEEEQAWIQAGFACFRNQDDLCPGRNLLLP